MPTESELSFRASSPPVTLKTLRPNDTASTQETVRTSKAESLFTLDRDFWIDIGLVALLGGLSFAVLKLVEYVVLTDAIVGLF